MPYWVGIGIKFIAAYGSNILFFRDWRSNQSIRTKGVRSIHSKWTTTHPSILLRL